MILIAHQGKMNYDEKKGTVLMNMKSDEVDAMSFSGEREDSDNCGSVAYMLAKLVMNRYNKKCINNPDDIDV